MAILGITSISFLAAWLYKERYANGFIATIDAFLISFAACYLVQVIWDLYSSTYMWGIGNASI